MQDELFMESYKHGKNTGSWGNANIHWRAYIACWAANKAKNLEGDFVECGVNKGGLAMTVMHYTNFKTLKKRFYLLDTFCGLSERYISEEEKKMASWIVTIITRSVVILSKKHLKNSQMSK